MKLRKLDELPALVSGRRVVLANGCFDILHVGHVRYLTDARSYGDVLVVAINNDASVRRLKGPGRPILTLEERVTLVSALVSVDYVVTFGEPDVRAVIDCLHPHIHAKGTDYTEDTVPERDQVSRYGGEVRIAGDPKDHSTKDTMARILERFGPEAGRHRSDMQKEIE